MPSSARADVARPVDLDHLRAGRDAEIEDRRAHASSRSSAPAAAVDRQAVARGDQPRFRAAPEHAEADAERDETRIRRTKIVRGDGDVCARHGRNLARAAEASTNPAPRDSARGNRTRRTVSEAAAGTRSPARPRRAACAADTTARSLCACHARRPGTRAFAALQVVQLDLGDRRARERARWSRARRRRRPGPLPCARGGLRKRPVL